MRNGIDQPYTGLTEDQVNDLNLKLLRPYQFIRIQS